MNPLLQTFDTPFETAPFQLLKTEHFMPAFEETLGEARAEIAAIATNADAPTFENTVVALDQAAERLNRVSEIFFNLNAAETNDEIQRIAREISPALSDFSNDVLLNEALFSRIREVYAQRGAYHFTTEQHTLLDKTYKRFARSGANLGQEEKQQLRELSKRLTQLGLQFGENLLKETNEYFMEITDPAELEGLPDDLKEAAAETAKEKGKADSWVFTLQFPSYVPFMTYAKNRQRREELAKAYSTRCCHGGETDNQGIIREIAALRHELALLLGYRSHAHFVLEERMAESPERVSEFLDDLLKQALPVAHREMEELTEFARQLDGLSELQRWDFSYYAEKLKKEKYEVDDEMLKPYFQLEKVVTGVFDVAARLFKLKFVAQPEIPVYHPDVKAYEVQDVETGKHIGVFYADYFPRPGKRNGAWMTSYRNQKIVNDREVRPHVSIVCNFTKPTASNPSLLTFNEVTTLFHEFGHALHGLLAEGQYESLTGTNVYWDFVELPSQIMENWAYEKEVLDMFAAHHKTGEKIPLELVDRIKKSANFMQGYQTVRQISFGKLDMAWHGQDPRGITDIMVFEEQAMAGTQLLPKVAGSSMSCSFGHIFQGGYAAGYYSYKWAEVLDADAFELFQERGLFDQAVAKAFREHILSAGGSEHPMILYRRFRGQEPSPKALLKRSGLVGTNS